MWIQITEYSDQLLDGLEGLSWPEGTMTAQKAWIGKSQGAKVVFPLATQGQGDIEVRLLRN